MIIDSVHSDTIELDGQRIQYYYAGLASPTAVPLVLLHGGGVDSARISWGPILPLLAEKHRVIAPDLPGYGGSYNPEVSYTMEYYIDFLGRFLDALGLDKVCLGGISLGGSISLAFSLDNPERVEKLILVDSYGIQSKGPYHKLSYLYAHSPLNEFSYRVMKGSRKLIRQSLAALIYDPKNITDELMDDLMRIMQNPSVGLAWMSFQRSEMGWKNVRSDYTDRLESLRASTLILHGDLDALVPVACAEKAHSLIKNSRLVILKNRKHWALRDNPGEIVELMSAFLLDN